MAVKFKLSNEEKERANRFLEIMNEQKSNDTSNSNLFVNQNINLPGVNNKANNYALPTVRLATNEEKNIKQKTINKSNNLLSKVGYVAKKGGTGILSGITGIAQAGLTDTANNLQKGNDKSGVEVATNLLEATSGILNPMQTYNKYIKNLPNMIGNAIKTINDKDSNTIEKITSLGTTALSDALSNNTARNILDSGVQLVGKVLPDNASEKTLELNKKISEPIDKINQNLYLEGQNYDKATQFMGDATQSVGNMVPSIAVTAITKNPNIGLLTMGISAKGQSTQEALNKGATLNEAIKIGDTKGAIEVATEMLTGGVNIFGKGALDDIVEKGIKDKVKSKVGKYLLEKGYQLGGEVLEETISDVLGTAIDKGTVDPDATYSIEDWGDTAVTTILSTLILNAITGGIGKTNNYDYNTQQRLQEAQNIIDNVNNKNNLSNLQQEQINNNSNIQIQQIIPQQNKMYQNQTSNQIQLPIRSYQYVETENTKINNLRQDMSKYWIDTNETKALGSVIEKIITDKGYNVRLDNTIKNQKGNSVNAQITTLNNGEVEIRINPNAKNVGEFLLMHETTHAIGTQEMKDLVMDYASKNTEFNNALESLKETYGVQDVSDEVLADISGQLFGNQEFINNLSMEKPNIFKRIYNKIIELANKITGNSNEALFIRNLENKWQEAYRTQNNNLNNNSYYSIQTDTNGNRYIKVDTDQHIFDGIAEKDYNKIAKMYMQDYLMGKTTLSNNDNTIIDRKSINKYTNPGNTQYQFEEKMKLTPELRNVLKISEKVAQNLPTKSNSKYSKWEYYKFKFTIDGNSFEGLVNIGIDNNGNKHFYEINQIKKTSISGTSLNRGTSLSNNSILPTNKNVNNTTKYSIQNKEKNTQNRINENQIPKEIYNKLRNEKLYFRFDDEGGFRGKEHMSGVAMWEDTIIDKINENNKGYYDENDNYIEKNSLLERYGITQEQYYNMNNEQQFKINQEIAIDEGLVTNGASVFELTEDGLDFFERYDSDHYETDYPQFNIFAGKHNGWGADGESVVIPSEVFYTGKTQEISDILYDYELTNKQKVDKILDLIEKTYNNSKKMNNANLLYSIQEFENNSKWQDYLEKNFKPTGTRTNLEDIKLPTKEYFENKKMQEVLTDADYEVLNKIYEKEGKTQILTEKKKAKLLEKYANDKFAIKDSLDILAQKFINKGHYIDQLSQKANNPELKFTYDRNLNSFAEGQYVIGVAQTDNQGNNIGKSINDIWRPIEDKGLTKEFSEYLLHKHNIDRSGRNKFIFGEEIGATESTAIALELENRHPEFKQYAKDIKEFNHNNLNNLKEAGMLTQDTIDYIEAMYPNYIAISRNIEDSLYTGNNEKTGTTSPLKKATGGNADIQPIKETMAQQSIRIKRLINQNELGKELSKTLKNSIVDEGVDISLSPTMLLDMDTMVDTDVDGSKYYLYFEDGKQLKLKINDNLYESLKATEISKIEKTLPVKALQKVNNIHRSLLTSSNPLFIVTNFFKDFQDGAFNSKYSSKFVKNYGKALNEIYTKGKYYESYMANGGMSNTYFDYETGIKKTNKFVEKIRNSNEIVEQLPRLAEFISTLEDGKSLNEALYNAAEITTNFKRGGDITKAINRNGANFLNASIQGFDKQFRNFSGQNGAKGYINLLAKATIMSIMPAIFNHMLLSDDEDYQDLPQSDKDLYYLFKYDEGKFRRIPKGRVLSIFGAAARRTLEMIQGQDDAWDDFGSTIINQVAPNNPLEDNILAPIIQVKNNKTWYGTDLVSSRLQKELPENQYDEKTDNFSKWLGKQIKVSPKKINYLIDQYSGGIGDIILPMITPQAKQNVFVDKFTTDSVLKNKNVSKFYETLEKQTQIANDNFATDEDELQLKYLNSISKDMSDLYKEKRQVQMSNISNKEKTQKVREIQEKINQLAEKGLINYKNGSQNKNSSKIGDEEYYKNSNGEWTILTDEEKNKNTNISTETYSDYKQKVYNKKNEKVSNGELKKSQDLKPKDKIQILLDSKYSEKEKKAIYENYIKSSNDTEYDIMKQTGINFEQYLKYKQQDFESDKKDDGTTTGKTVSGSKKTKVYDYINNMNIEYNQKLVLLGTQYTLTSSEKSKLANYINELNIKKGEKLKIYEKLKGFTVYKDGRVTW